VILIDANLLLYAYQPSAAQHERSRRWLENALSGSDLVRFAWITLWAFVRIATNPRVFEYPLARRQAHSSWMRCSQPLHSSTALRFFQRIAISRDSRP
jgi:predicted nucleic acid-binding protein